jgi:glucose-6-phosphate isomerase
VTFGWGPRFLHSTGQFHKGGPAVGVYVQVTAEPQEDLAIPGGDFGFATLIAAQAAGDARVLADHGRPVLRLHVTGSQDEGLAAVRAALEGGQ